MNIFSDNSVLGRFLLIVFDIVLLHFLWILCSLPLFTIGASTTALYYSCMKRIRTGEGYVSKNFFHAFKDNFKQATCIWLLLLAVAFVLILDLRIGMNIEGILGTVILVSNAVLLIPFLLTVLYIFPVQAKFENRIIDNLKNALFMSIQNFHYSLLIVAILASFIILGTGFQSAMGLMLFCGVGLYGYLSSCIYISVFRKYLPDETKEDAEKSGIEQILR